jgi:hypothetical protein
VGEGTTQPRPAVVAAREALLASRASLDEELVRLEASARAAVDIPAKIKRHPAKAAGLAAGAGFVVVGGPRRLFRRARSAVMGPPEPMPTSMLPKEIDKALGKLGSDGEQVRGTIEREFAAYLEQTAPSRRRQSLVADLRAVMTTGLRGFMFRAGRDLAGRLVSTDPTLYREELERIRSRRAPRGGDEAP